MHVFILGCGMHVLRQGTLKAFVPRTRIKGAEHLRL